MGEKTLSKGQRAMIAARDAGPNLNASEVARVADVSQSQMSLARGVLARTPHLVEDVVAGRISLNQAYHQAREAPGPVPVPELTLVDAEDQLDRHRLLPDEVRTALAERLRAAHQAELEVLAEADDLIRAARERRRDLIDRLAAMSLTELEDVVGDRLAVEEADRGVDGGGATGESREGEDGEADG